MIYLAEEDIPGKWERVAILTSKGESNWTSESQMYESMRKKAAEIGANGILYTAIEEPSAGAKIAGAFLGTGSQRRAEMVAIYVHPEP